jgi:hypothetical protein
MTSIYVSCRLDLCRLLLNCLNECIKCKKSNNSVEYKKLFVDYVRSLLKGLNKSNINNRFMGLMSDPVCQQKDPVSMMFVRNIPNIIKTWENPENFKKEHNNRGNIEYIDNPSLQKAAHFVNEEFGECDSVKILDIGSGNGNSAFRLLSFLDNKFSVTCTDPSGDDHRTTNKSRFTYESYSSNSLQAINSLNKFNDVILIMSPVPSSVKSNGFPDVCGGGFDLITIQYMINNNIKKPIIIIGECGAGDSLQGMHHYLTNNPKLDTKYHIIKNEVKDINYPDYTSMIGFTKVPTRVMKLIYFVDVK